MSWIATDNFESYTITNDMNGLNGGSNWTGAWSAAGALECVIVAAPAGFEGSNAARILYIAGDGGEAGRTFTATSEGTVSFIMSAAQTDKAGRITFTDTSIPATRFLIRFDSDGNIKAVGSASNTLQAYNANQAYTISVKFGHTSGNFAVSIDGGAYSADFDCNGTGSQTDNLFITNENASLSSFYFDDIKPGAATTANNNNLILLGVG